MVVLFGVIGNNHDYDDDDGDDDQLVIILVTVTVTVTIMVMAVTVTVTSTPSCSCCSSSFSISICNNVYNQTFLSELKKKTYLWHLASGGSTCLARQPTMTTDKHFHEFFHLDQFSVVLLNPLSKVIHNHLHTKFNKHSF